MTCGIYRITEKETGRHYIGQSKNIEGRWKRHHKRFPPNLFSYEILLKCDDDVLDFFEKAFIDGYDSHCSGFNLTKGGSGAWGSKNPEETRRKLSEALKGKPSNNKGKKISEETRRKLSEAAKNRKKNGGVS